VDEHKRKGTLVPWVDTEASSKEGFAVWVVLAADEADDRTGIIYQGRNRVVNKKNAQAAGGISQIPKERKPLGGSGEALSFLHK
jgi:hypothetical protein